LNEELVSVCRSRSEANGLHGLIEVRQGDLREWNAHEACSIVVAYMLPEAMPLLEPKLRAALAHARYVIAVVFPIPNWRPLMTNANRTVYFYDTTSF
jgi:hypothetical protein